MFLDEGKMDRKAVRSKILTGSLKVLKEKGARFTMDDLARCLSMSKKTIYKVFSDKEAILTDLVDNVFDQVAKDQKIILDDRDLSVVDKLRGILCVLPVEARGINFAELFRFRGKYPRPYQRMESRIESNWEPTFELIQRGIEERQLRPVNPSVIKVIYESTIERLLYGDRAAEMELDYNEALEEVASLIIDGIKS